MARIVLALITLAVLSRLIPTEFSRLSTTTTREIPVSVVPERPTLPPAMAAHLAFAREATSGERALELVDFMDPSFRVPGNEPFNAAIYRVADVLQAAGFEEEGPGIASPLTYRIEHRPLRGPTWEPVSASLGILGEQDPLMTLSTNLNLIAANSHSTPVGGVEAELVDVGGGEPEDWEGLELAGKIVMGDGSPRRLFRNAVQERGALGVLAFGMAEYNRPDVNRTIAPLSSIPQDPEAGAWALLLSRNARDALRNALAEGPVRVRVEIQSRVYPSEELTLVAEVRGSEEPEERFVFSAHVQESGANDNASGVAVLAEIATAMGEGFRTGAIRPRRTVTMIWGDEIQSTRRYLQDDSLRAAGVRWGLSLDMVGEDTEKTGGTFLIEKMPDPSAVWTRGEDRHTEWGGRPMTPDRLTPHYFNDLVLNRCLDQAAETGWTVKTNPFEGGSDHVPFLQAGVPGILLWHFPDQFYHTDGDRLEVVSGEVMRNVAVCATTTAMVLTDPDPVSVSFLVREVERAALDRIAREAELSRAAVRTGSAPEEEGQILESWTQWYDAALGSLAELELGGPSQEIVAELAEARERVVEAGREAVAGLGSWAGR